MEMPEYLVLGQTYALIGRAVARTSCSTSSGMFTKHASLPDLLLRCTVGVPDDLRFAARFCRTGSSSDELSSKSYLRFLRSLSWRSPDVEAAGSASMGSELDDGRREMVEQRAWPVGAFKWTNAKPRPCPGIYIGLTYTNASRTCLVLASVSGQLFISTSTAMAQIADVLKQTLNPDTNTRVAAELSLTQLLAQPSTFVLDHHAPHLMRVAQARASPYHSSFWPRMQRSR